MIIHFQTMPKSGFASSHCYSDVQELGCRLHHQVQYDCNGFGGRNDLRLSNSSWQGLSLHLCFLTTVYFAMHGLEIVLRLIVEKFCKAERIDRFGYLGNAVLCMIFSCGVFSLLFGFAGIAFAKDGGETPITWAFDGILVGLSVSCFIGLAATFLPDGST